MPELVAVPAGVRMAILPVLTPVGTVAVTLELKFTVNALAFTPPNVTCDALFRPRPSHNNIAGIPAGGAETGNARPLLGASGANCQLFGSPRPFHRTPDFSELCQSK